MYLTGRVLNIRRSVRTLNNRLNKSFSVKIEVLGGGGNGMSGFGIVAYTFAGMRVWNTKEVKDVIE
jgi:hypothetical protein